MSKKLSIVLGLAILLLSFAIFSWLTSNPPKARKKPAVDQRISVETQRLVPTHYATKIKSYGRVQARTQSQLKAEVVGKVSWISPKLRAGSGFKKGDLLIRIDSKDYQSQISMTSSKVVEARLNYEQELALSKQAKRNWERLSLDREPTDLVLRKPQLAAAKAAWDSARAELNMANNDYSRTNIHAPYDGWVLNKYVDVAQVVSAGSQLADIYSQGNFEIRLPIALADLKLIELPENIDQASNYPKAKIINDLGTPEQAWQATIIRSDASIDDKTQQLYVTARIEKAINISPGETPRRFKINQYANAVISGKTFHQVLAIPNRAITQGRQVYVVDSDERIQQRIIEIKWQDEEVSIIDSGLQAGDELILTPLGDFALGQPIKRINQNNSSSANSSAGSAAQAMPSQPTLSSRIGAKP